MKFRLNLNTKILLYILGISIFIYSSSIVVVSVRMQQLAYDDAKNITDAYAREYANAIKAELNTDMGVVRSISQAFIGFEKLKAAERMKLYLDQLKNLLRENPEYLAVWTSWELSALDSNYKKNYGRERAEMHMLENRLLVSIDTLNKNGDTGMYKMIKALEQEFLTDPYFYTYKDDTHKSILETSISAPMIINNKYGGMVGIDVPLDRFLTLTNKIQPFTNSYAFLLANNGMYVAHPNRELLGKYYAEVEKLNDTVFHVVKNLKKGITFSFLINKSKDKPATYISFAPITIGKSPSFWSLAIAVPVDVIMEQATQNLKLNIAIGFLGLLMLAFVIVLISLTITRPLRNTTDVLNDLAKGKIDKHKKLKVTTSDEIGQMAQSLNTVIDGLNSTTYFAHQIGIGNLSAEFTPLSEDDLLGNALLDMRKSLQSALEEDQKRKLEDERQNWATKGYAKFAELLRSNNDNMREFSLSILSNLVKFLNASMGAIFIINDDNPKRVFLEMTATFAYENRRLKSKEFNIGEGFVGRCANERKTLLITDLPKGYIQINSGLGQTDPKNLLIVPLKFNEVVFGVIEMASFKIFEYYQIQFIEKLGESIATTISTVKNNIRTARLFEESKIQSEELKIREEELKRNLLELQEAQLQMENIKKEEAERTEELMKIMDEHREMLVHMLNEMEDRIFLKDSESRMILVNNAVARYHNMTIQEIIGKTDFDFLEAEKAQVFREEEIEIMQTGIPKTIRYKQVRDGEDKIMVTTKMPFYISYLHQTGILGIQKDITEIVNLETKIAYLTAELEILKG